MSQDQSPRDAAVVGSSIIYDGFISYSHSKDKPIATALQSAVQGLGKPWYRRRAIRIFRDDTSLTATPHLWPDIESALKSSHYFILLASPEAAASPWINKEVTLWLQCKGVETLLIGLTAGDLSWDDTAGDFIWCDTTPLPPVLKRQFSDDPRWIDLREYRSGASLRDRRFVEACAEFAAAIRGFPKEDLLSEEVRQQRRALMLAWSAVCSLLLLAGALAWKWNAAVHAEQRAVLQRDRAERTLAASTSTANDLVMQVAVKVRNRLGIPVSLVREVLTRSQDLLNKLLEGGEVSPNLRRDIAVALRELATTSIIQGDIATALEMAEKSRDIMLGLLAEDAGNAEWLRELSLSHNRIGEALSRAGRHADALSAFRLAFDLRQQLAANEPGNPETQRDLAVTHERIGDELIVDGQIDDARESYQDAFEIRQQLSMRSRAKREWSRDLSVSYEKMGDVSFRVEDFTAALESYTKSFEIREALSRSDKEDAEVQRDLAVSFAKIGDVNVNLKETEAAIAAYRRSLTIRDRLATADPGNARWQSDIVVILIKLGDSGDDPLLRYTRALEIAHRLASDGKLVGDQERWVPALEKRLLQL
jgi:tetratricopeptide (TPR) repeat protein